MLATYGVDPLDPSVSLRRIHVLLTRLPAGSVPAADTPAAWTIESHLLAGLIDSMNALIFVTLKAHGGRPTRPRPMPRPGARTQATGRQVAWGDLRAALTSTGAVADQGASRGR